MKTPVDVVIIGGGIVGCSTAYNLLKVRPKTRLVLLEKEPALGVHQTGHNSGVIHAGLYYRPGSLKSHMARVGYLKLIQFCRDHDVTFDICGKIVVALNEIEVAWLEELDRRGHANGLRGLRRLDRAGIRELEPNSSGVAGLHVPQTGIVDFRKVTERLGDLIKEAGGEIVNGADVVSVNESRDSVTIDSSTGTWSANVVVTCAGLHADRIMAMTTPIPPFRILPFRGEYYELAPDARHLVRNIIYPVPNPDLPFLGVHFTRTIDGSIACGPNAVPALSREGYLTRRPNLRDCVDVATWPGTWRLAARHWRTGLGEIHRSLRMPAFLAALKRLVPAVRADDLKPSTSGIRAQACDRNGRLLDDFSIHESHRVVHLCNAPSPAATASLAIGERLSELAIARLQ